MCPEKRTSRIGYLSPERPRRTADRLVMGLMAGTSGDGIDATCARIRGTGEAMEVSFLWHRHFAFAPTLRRRLLAAMAPAATRTEELARLHADMGEAFAGAALSAMRSVPARDRPTLIGLAGQTVCHLPPTRRGGPTVTLQLGDPARVAARTGITTAAEFRQSDVAVGGQGAPLVPWTDYVLFRNPTISRAVQNIGGIGNVTYVPAGGSADDVIAFDTGPGNMIIDALVAHVTGGRERMDRDGRRAARGRVLDEVLKTWLRHPFLKNKPPKSTGRETFGRVFVEAEIRRLRRASSSPNDWIATATAFTAHSIADAYRRFLPRIPRQIPAASPVLAQARRAARRQRARNPLPPSSLHAREVIVCGGGEQNPTLMAMLAAELGGWPIRSIESLGIPAQAKESLSFGVLAAACSDASPANLPQVTGAERRTVLGHLVHP